MRPTLGKAPSAACTRAAVCRPRAPPAWLAPTAYLSKHSSYHATDAANLFSLLLLLTVVMTVNDEERPITTDDLRLLTALS